MSTALHYAISGLGLFGLLVGIAALVALVYLYVRTRLRGTLWLLIWKSPIMALGSYLYLRSGWRWPKSVLVWVPFGLLTVAGWYGRSYAWARLFQYAHSHGDTILGLRMQTFAAISRSVTSLAISALLFIAVVFLTQDLLRLTRTEVQAATPDVES